MTTEIQIDIDSLTQSLLNSEEFLTSLSQNPTAVSKLSQNKDFIKSLAENPVLRKFLKSHFYEFIDPATFEILKRMGVYYL